MTQVASRSYKAIFFDLDGTLIPMDGEEFIRRYFKELGKFLLAEGYEDPKFWIDCVNKGTYAMIEGNNGATNEETFWQAFCNLADCDRNEFEPVIDRFYNTNYNNIGSDLERFDLAVQAIDTLRQKGYPLYLTTMPLFPRVGVANRLQWVGLDAASFEEITSYDKARHVKPSLDYYKENIARAGVPAANILVVGNNTAEDLVAMELGCDAFLVTDWIIDPKHYDYSAIKHGSFADFLNFVQQLPPCK